jgi:hypothetical protein
MSNSIRLEILFRPAMDPFDRQWFEEQLEEALIAEQLGEVIGGGTALDGSISDISVDIYDRNRGIAIALEVLRREHAPLETEVVENGDTPLNHQLYDEQHPYIKPEANDTHEVESRQPRATDLPQLGDTYLVPLGERLFGACRVIAIRNDAYATLMAGTNWFGETPPELSDPRLRSLLIHTCVGAVGPSCTFWLNGKPPKTFDYLGLIQPSEEEQRRSYGQHTDIWSHIADSLFMEWEWLNEQEENR